jgi:hypothetical protein
MLLICLNSLREILYTRLANGSLNYNIRRPPCSFKQALAGLAVSLQTIARLFTFLLYVAASLLVVNLSMFVYTIGTDALERSVNI